jgi:hypothetical protein
MLQKEGRQVLVDLSLDGGGDRQSIHKKNKRHNKEGNE